MFGHLVSHCRSRSEVHLICRPLWKPIKKCFVLALQSRLAVTNGIRASLSPRHSSGARWRKRETEGERDGGRERRMERARRREREKRRERDGGGKVSWGEPQMGRVAGDKSFYGRGDIHNREHTHRDRHRHTHTHTLRRPLMQVPGMGMSHCSIKNESTFWQTHTKLLLLT